MSTSFDLIAFWKSEIVTKKQWLYFCNRLGFYFHPVWNALFYEYAVYAILINENYVNYKKI